MTAVFDTRPPVAKDTVSGSGLQVQIPSSIAALGNTTVTLGVSRDGYNLIGIENPVLSGATNGSPKATYISGNQIQIYNVSTVACKASGNILRLTGTLVWARNNLAI